MKHLCLVIIGVLPWVTNGSAQSLLAGRLLGERYPGAGQTIPFCGILCFDSRLGSGSQPAAFRTWETEPVGWFRFSTEAGQHTLLFTGPNHFLRPIVLNNIFLRPGEKLEDLRPEAVFDYYNFYEAAWDPKPARAYFQTFAARGKSLTHVGVRLVSDGVDGAGPLSQNFVVSIHRRGPGTPDTWEQVGPSRPILNVDAGGAKSYLYSAGWNSGEVPMIPGETYAVQLRPERAGATFQSFWRPDSYAPPTCYRIGSANAGFEPFKLWLAVGSDSDGLLIPYNKCVQKEFGPFAGFAARWSQTYMAQGRSLAGVVLYAAVGGAQPPLSRQRVRVRVRQGGPGGPVTGLDKIAVGNGNYTGDASWGSFGVAFAPGEAPLAPGQKYAIDFESLESPETLRGFVNIKGAVSDGRAGFNPYRKFAPDDYAKGAAYKNGAEEMPFDLDMQILEYEFAAKEWPQTGSTNFLSNGSMELFTPGPAETPIDAAPPRGVSGYAAGPRAVAGEPQGWRTFSLDAATRFAVVEDTAVTNNHYACIFSRAGQTADGGLAQGVTALSHSQTYVLGAKVRATWAIDYDHQCMLGLDPTGQTSDAKAASILWTNFPPRHGEWLGLVTQPIRPDTNSISVWLRARSTQKADGYAPFRADFDEVTLRQVSTSPPQY